jgi:hypothetical protein
MPEALLAVLLPFKPTHTYGKTQGSVSSCPSVKLGSNNGNNILRNNA